MVRRILLPVVLVSVLAIACGASGKQQAGTATIAPASVAASARSHVVVLVMENREQQEVLGDGSYLAGLARRGALLTKSYGVTHPSLPNYIALTSGDTQGITSNCTDCRVSAPSIVSRLEAGRRSWKGYMEDMPRPCFDGAFSNGYAKKHNPFVYFDDVLNHAARCRKVVPFGQLARDLKSGRLPQFSFITPNLCNDTHDCPVDTGDKFLARTVPAILRGLGPHGFLVVTYDEGSSDAGCCGSSAGGLIATVVAGPDVRRGTRLTTPIDHVGVLATILRALGLPALGATPDPRHGSFTSVFTRAPRVR